MHSLWENKLPCPWPCVYDNVFVCVFFQVQHRPDVAYNVSWCCVGNGTLVFERIHTQGRWKWSCCTSWSISHVNFSSKEKIRNCFRGKCEESVFRASQRSKGKRESKRKRKRKEKGKLGVMLKHDNHRFSCTVFYDRWSIFTQKQHQILKVAKA